MQALGSKEGAPREDMGKAEIKRDSPVYSLLGGCRMQETLQATGVNISLASLCATLSHLILKTT